MPEPGHEPLVVFEGVTRRFGDTVAVERMDLAIGEGEFVAIMGSSGCGKTTTLRMLAGLERPSEGEIRIEGRRVNELSPAERDTPHGVADAGPVSVSRRAPERGVRPQDARHPCAGPA